MIALVPALLACPAPAQTVAEPRCAVEGLDNPRFLLPLDPEKGVAPWWRARRGAPRVEVDDAGAWLVTGPEDVVQQPLAAYGPLVGELSFSGRVEGAGVLQVVDGRGGLARVELRGAPGGTEFAFTGADLAQLLGRAPEPRFVVQLLGDPELAARGVPATARWAEVRAGVALPCPEEAVLRAELVDLLRWSFGEFLARALDDAGPRATAFVAHDFDAFTGERLGAPHGRVGFHPLYAQLLQAWRAEPLPEWEAALVRFVDDWLALGMHPETGLPRLWDPVRDEPVDGQALQIRSMLELLLDLAESGPEAVRERCLAQAARIGEAVLARGVLPNGDVAALYRPSDGQALTETEPIRRLNVPEQLARLGRRLGDERYLAAARGAVLQHEYDHFWPGQWDSIDPGFDDEFGNYGSRAIEMWRAWPEEEAFRFLVVSGFEHYAPLWRDALWHGGNVAADQVRCWRIAADLAALEPARAPAVGALVGDALRNHFKGEQTGGGGWIDVTVVGFDPQQLPVGDTAGVPQNLLEGLAVAYDERLGLRTDATRARYAAVLRAARATYAGPHGLMETPRRVEGGANPAIGSLRLHPGAIRMLERL